MKKISLLLIILLLLPSMFAASSLFDDKARLILVRTNPDSVEPGTYFDVSLRLQDVDDGIDLGNAKITLKENFPFSIYPGDFKTQDLGTIKDGGIIEFKYRVWVDEAASGGDYDLYFILSSDNIQNKEAFVTISVTPLQAVIAVDSVSSFPEKIRPGEKAQLNVRLQNTAGILMRDIIAKINLDLVPITPLHSGVEKRITSLDKDDYVDLTFDVIVNTNAEIKPYKIPLYLTYYDASGNMYVWNTSFGILIEAKPEYQIDIEDSKVFAKGQTGDIVISVSNTGLSNINFLSLEIKEGDNYKVVGTNRVYIGNLESDDYDTADFTIYVSDSDYVDLNLELKYKDAYNNDYSDIKKVRLELYSSQEAMKYGLLSKPSFTWIIWLIIVIIVYAVFKQWRKDKDIGVAVKHVLKRWLGFIFRPLIRLFSKKKR